MYFSGEAVVRDTRAYVQYTSEVVNDPNPLVEILRNALREVCDNCVFHGITCKPDEPIVSAKRTGYCGYGTASGLVPCGIYAKKFDGE